MRFHTNIQEKPVPEPEWVAWPYIDTLYDYVEFLKRGPIASLLQRMEGTPKWPLSVLVPLG